MLVGTCGKEVEQSVVLGSKTKVTSREYVMFEYKSLSEVARIYSVSKI